MSRREIKAKDLDHICFVGYDRGMQTFFAQVEDRRIQAAAYEAADRVSDALAAGREPSDADAEACERDSIIFWIGADTIGQVPTVEMLASQLRPYALLSPEMAETLKADQQSAESTARTEHQRAMMQFVLENTRG